MNGKWKASPKLRRLAHYAEQSEGNGWRAEMAQRQSAIKYGPEDAQEPPEAAARSMMPRSLADDSQEAVDQGAQLNVFVRLSRPEVERAAKDRATVATPVDETRYQIDLGEAGQVDLVLNGLVGAASVSEQQLNALLEDPIVESVDAPDAVRRPLVLRGAPAGGVDSDLRLRDIPGKDLHRGGEGVLIGVIDVDGFDFSHPDFLTDDGRTRFVRIWDQAGAGQSPLLRGARSYGVELDCDLLDRALRVSQEVGIAPYHLVPQSSTVPGSHGTHVASIAAGNSGVCPNSDIAAVLIHLPTADLNRRGTFTDSTRITDAIAYLIQVQEELGYKAISINISLGTNGHAHDGTSLASRWIDSELDQQGRCICIAAGNAGQDEPESVDDLGFIVGRIHTSGKLDAAGLTKDIHLRVAGFPVSDVSENEVEIWYAPQDRFDVTVRAPNGGQWTERRTPGDPFHEELARDREGRQLDTVVGVFSEIFRSENGSNRISVFLTPKGQGAHVEPGVWTIRLHAREIRNGRYDGWIERDDPIPIQGVAPQQLWHYPSFFEGASNVDNSSISTLACTRSAIAVANVDDRTERIAVSSSQGPTRDGQLKPEIGAAGTQVVAANAFHPVERTVAMTGTSMASPFVAGVVGLMLALEPRLTSAQIRGIITRTARPLPGANYEWRDDAGYGLIDAARCVEAVTELQEALRKAEQE